MEPEAFGLEALRLSAPEGRSAPPPKAPAPAKVFHEPREGAHELEVRPVRAASALASMKGKHANLIAPPFLMAISAGVRQGKSCLVTNLVYRKEFYRGMWPRIYLISPTAHADPTFEPFAADPACETHCPTSSAELDASVDHILEEVAPGGVPTGPALLVVDDCAAFLKNGDALCRLATKYRHFGLSIIVTSQYYLRLPPVIRVNVSALVVFRILNSRERDILLDELRATFGDDLLRAYREIFDADPHRRFQFMVLNLRDRWILDSFQKIVAE